MTSAIPATISAVAALWAAAHPTVDVRDGLTLSGDAGAPSDNIFRRVHVGVIPDTDAGTTFNREWASLGAIRITEVFDIPCHLECVSGDEDLVAIRAAAFTLFDSLAAAIAANRTLGGLLQEGAAVLGDGSLILGEDDEGGSVAIRFDVHCQTTVFDTA